MIFENCLNAKCRSLPKDFSKSSKSDHNKSIPVQKPYKFSCLLIHILHIYQIDQEQFWNSLKFAMTTNHLFFALDKQRYSANEVANGIAVLVVQEEELKCSRLVVRWIQQERTTCKLLFWKNKLRKELYYCVDFLLFVFNIF